MKYKIKKQRKEQTVLWQIQCNRETPSKTNQDRKRKGVSK